MELNEHIGESYFQKYWLVMRRCWLPALQVFSMTMLLAGGYAWMQRPVYQSQVKLLFTANRSASLTGLSKELVDQIGQLQALSSRDNPLDTQAEVIRSDAVVSKTIDELGLKDANGDPLTAKNLTSRITAKGILGTDVLTISYRSYDPEQTVAVVNKLADIYIQNNVRSNQADAAAAGKFIEEQLPRTEAAVQAADSALRQFKEANKVIELDKESDQAITIIGDLENQTAQARAELADVAAQSKTLQTQLGVSPQQAVMLAALSQTPAVQEVLTQYQQTQAKLEVARTRYLPTHPEITNSERELAALSALLEQRIGQIIGAHQALSLGNLQMDELRRDLIGQWITVETKRRGLVERITQMMKDQTAYKQQASVLPQLEQKQRELERNLNAAQTTYETLLRRLQEIRVAENQNVGNAQVISPARQADFVGPAKRMILLGGGVVGALLAISTAFALDFMDQSIKTPQEARRLFGYSLLGLIPTYDKTLKNHRVLVRDLPRSSVAQAYRLLRANLRFIGSDQKLKTLVVTSSVPQEGKSEVAANLAAAIAQTGRRVLLIDTDFHLPAQHRIWQTSDGPDLSNVLIHQIPPDEVVRQIRTNLCGETMSNLHVLPAGGPPLDSLALLDSNQMALLIQSFAQHYDFVILDSPPLVGLADAAVLGKIVDGLLLVVRPGVLNVAHAKATKEFLAQSDQNVLGLVINGVDLKTDASGFYSTRYSLAPDISTQAAAILQQDPSRN